MIRTRILVAAIALSAVCAVATAEWAVFDKGAWPETWPKALEPLRKQSRSIRGGGGVYDLSIHHIPFKDRDAFDAAWPELLKVKTKGAPLVLLRSPNTHWYFGKMTAGVLIHTPSPEMKIKEPAQPFEPTGDVVTRWWHTIYIELVVDGEIVDLNRIPLPPDTPIIDERFKPDPKGERGTSVP
jgi:hypothetical protein